MNDKIEISARREELVEAGSKALAPIVNGASDEEKYAAAGVVAAIVIDAILPLLR